MKRMLLSEILRLDPAFRLDAYTIRTGESRTLWNKSGPLSGN